MSTYESLEQQYDTLATRYASSVLSESAYRKTFAEIMDRYKTLICDYGNNLDRFVNSSMYKHSGTEDKIKGIEDLYLFIQKKYIMMVRLYNLLCPADKHSESPDRPSADSTLLISVSAGSIQKYMKSRE